MNPNQNKEERKSEDGVTITSDNFSELQKAGLNIDSNTEKWEKRFDDETKLWDIASSVRPELKRLVADLLKKQEEEAYLKGKEGAYEDFKRKLQAQAALVDMPEMVEIISRVIDLTKEK